MSEPRDSENTDRFTTNEVSPQPGHDPSEPTDPSSAETGAPEAAPTPFDHPLFLPVVCIGFTLWFGYDTYIHPMEDHLDFNHYGFKAVLGASVWYGYQAWAEINRRRVLPWVLPSIFAFLAAWLGAEAFGLPGFGLGDLIEYPQISLYGFYLCAALVPLSAAREMLRVKRSAGATNDPS